MQSLTTDYNFPHSFYLHRIFINIFSFFLENKRILLKINYKHNLQISCHHCRKSNRQRWTNRIPLHSHSYTAQDFKSCLLASFGGMSTLIQFPEIQFPPHIKQEMISACNTVDVIIFHCRVQGHCLPLLPDIREFRCQHSLYKKWLIQGKYLSLSSQNIITSFSLTYKSCVGNP